MHPCAIRGLLGWVRCLRIGQTKRLDLRAHVGNGHYGSRGRTQHIADTALTVPNEPEQPVLNQENKCRPPDYSAEYRTFTKPGDLPRQFPITADLGSVAVNTLKLLWGAYVGQHLSGP